MVGVVMTGLVLYCDVNDWRFVDSNRYNLII